MINEDNLPDTIKNKIIKINTKFYINETSDSSNKLKNNPPLSAQKINNNENGLKGIKYSILSGNFKTKRKNIININNMKKFIVPIVNGNTSYDNLRRSYSAFFYKINPPFEITNFEL